MNCKEENISPELFLKNFIEKEIVNSDDQFKLTPAESQEVFKNAIKAIEEIHNVKIDLGEFSKFLLYYKIMKVVESVGEQIRCDKYLEACKVKK